MNFRIFVAVENGKIIGLAGFKKTSGTVSGIFVEPDRMGEGIGSQLLEKLEEKAREKSLSNLEVPASLAAVEFYKKNGYESVKQEKREVEEKDILMLIMEKEF